MSQYLIRQSLAPLHLPMAMHPEIGLLHAMPRSAFTRYESLDDAKDAIRMDRDLKRHLASDALEIVTVEVHQAGETRLADRSARRGRMA